MVYGGAAPGRVHESDRYGLARGDRVPAGSVPHFLPGKNSFLDEMTKLYGIPAEAELGGAETMYPAYRDKIKDKFVMPAKCSRNCGGPAGQ